jgi:uncharacterized membrane protein
LQFRLRKEIALLSFVRVTLASLAAALCALGQCWAAPPSYTAVLIAPSRNTIDGQATGINNAGQVVGGFWKKKHPNSTGVLSDTATGTFRKIEPTFDAFTSFVTGINEAGYMVGYAGNGNYFNAFIASPYGESTHFVTFGGQHIVFANGINASRQIVGDIRDERNVWHAFITDADGRNLRKFSGENSFAKAINDAGQATGNFMVDDASRVFITDATGTPLDTGINGTAFAINAVGQIAGYLGQADNYATFMTGANGQGLRTLTAFPDAFVCYPYAINAHGQIVGDAQLYSGGYYAAFVSDVPAMRLYRLDELTDLPADVKLNVARAINDAGQIAASSTDGRVYLLTPNPATGSKATTGR